MRYFVSILVLQSSRWGRERAGCALLCLSSWCLVIVVWLFLMMPRVCLQFVIVVFPDHTYLLFFDHNRLDETSVVDRHRCHMAAKFAVFDCGIS